jgi:ADP-ribose pyrophosphatase YjhB (NUDIX family)
LKKNQPTDTKVVAPPAVSVDIVLLTLVDKRLHVGLVNSRSKYLNGQLALIGGTVHTDEDKTLDHAVHRILAQRGGLKKIFVEQLYTFGSKGRDPRGWSVSVAYYGLLPINELEKDKHELTFYPVDKLPKLPFDHKQIVEAAVDRVRGKGGYSTIPARLLGKKFSMLQMKQIYSAVLGEEIDMAAFRRKVLSLGIVRTTNEKVRMGRASRPSELFELVPGVVNFDSRI